MKIRRVILSIVSQLRMRNYSAVCLIFMKAVRGLLVVFFLPLGMILALCIRLLRPWVLVRIEILISERIGHFAGNTELYLCERDAGINKPNKRYIDLWYHNWPICNKQLARMWKRVLHIGPSCLLASAQRINTLLPGGEKHVIGNNTSVDRDVHNLMDQYSPHLKFLPEEEQQGEAGLRDLGVPAGAPFVCLQVRDDSYLNKSLPWRDWDYHSFRDCDIKNYVYASRLLADRGYYVIRMGVAVKDAMEIHHPGVIDYAANGMRTDFMDVYLGAKCEFCISNGTGFDAVPYIFRRPLVFVDHVPIEIIHTYSSRFLATTKKHWSRSHSRYMTFSEIFQTGAGKFFSAKNYEDMGIELFESTPEEIAAVVLEMQERLSGTWQCTEEDEKLQSQFWELFPEGDWHGKIYSRIGTDFLRRNKALLI